MDDPTTHERLRAIFARPGLEWLPDRLARRLRGGQPLDRPLTLAGADAAQRRAIDDLLGRGSTGGGSLTVDHARLCAGLGIGSLATILRACRPEIFTEIADREAHRDTWAGVFANAREIAAEPAWLEKLEGEGLLKRLAANDPGVAANLLQSALSILERLPAANVLLADLAAAATGDSHALDRGQPLSTLCLRAIRDRHGIDGLRDAAHRRRAWAAAGVLCDDLSAPVLAFNLAAPPGSSLAPFLDLYRARGLPVFLPLRQLATADFAPLPTSMREVFVCENPNLLGRAAAEAGSGCAPLVCTNGHPAGAAMFLLRRLAEAGATLRAHADFDWAGLRIVEGLAREIGAIPWRMDAASFLSAAATVPLRGRPCEPARAGDLPRVMAERGCAVFEEQVASTLIADLRAA